MRLTTRIASILACTAILLAGCSSKESAPAAAAPPANCKSMAPLLDLLPVANVMNGLPEATRECSGSGFQVAVTYGGSDPAKERYEFSVTPLDKASAYFKMDPPPANKQEQKDFRMTAGVYAALFRTMHESCSGSTAKVGEFDVCYSAENDGRSWSVLSVRGDLGYSIEYSPPAGAPASSPEAIREKLDPLFAQFRVTGK